MSIEAMKQALEALEANVGSYHPLRRSAITSLRQAIATAVAEPHKESSSDVVTSETQEPACCSGKCPNKKECESAMQCLYNHPQPKAEQETKREPLTLERIKYLVPHLGEKDSFDLIDMQIFARAIEAAHGIKGEA